MKKFILCSALVAVAGALFAADAKEEVTAAIKKLGEQPNYSWKTTVVVPDSARWRPGPTEGKTEKGGVLYQKMTFGDNTTEIVKQGDKAAFTDRDGEWQSAANSEGQEGRGRFMAAMVRSLQAPAAQAADIAGGVKEFKSDGDAWAGDLTEDAAKNLMRFRRGGGDGPTISDAKGSAKFWIKDGVLSKYEFKLSGKMDFNGNEMDMDRTTTVEIKDVGTTKVEVPEGAKAKLS
ncbi:MAG TPA: hypothetical protein VFV96_12720 [Verrucomicrobiae bacterium]|nr:hypothetical protein [Verrucomicrobiae bacterium]